MTVTAEREFEFEFTQNHYDTLRGIVTKETGIELPDHKKTLMYGRLVRRLRALSIADFDAYITMLQGQLRAGKDEELLAMMNAMTTNVTAFFREKHHFENLTKMLPELLQKFGEVQIWSSACSTGEEPWSIAMTVAEFIKTHPTNKIKILATDLDTTAVDTARNGVYKLNDEQLASHPLLKKYLKPTGNETGGILATKEYRIADEIRELLTFKQMNLIKPWTIMQPRFHVVFCRNVIIYFSKETQRSIFANFEKKMPAGSMLYIGHSESLLNVSDAYELIGSTAYTRKEDAA